MGNAIEAKKQTVYTAPVVYMMHFHFSSRSTFIGLQPYGAADLLRESLFKVRACTVGPFVNTHPASMHESGYRCITPLQRISRNGKDTIARKGPGQGTGWKGRGEAPEVDRPFLNVDASQALAHSVL